MTDYAAHQWPGTTTVQLQAGRGLLRERCIKCHHRPGPEMSQAAQWPDVLKLMAKRAELSDSERETVLHYLLAAKAMAQ